MDTVASNVGLCKDCNYPLRGLESRRCPECGREFDPNDPATMNMGKPLPYWPRPLLRPMRRGTKMLVILSAFGLLWAGMLLPYAEYVAAVSGVLGVALIAYQTLRILVKHLLAAHYRQPLRRESWMFVMWPILLALFIAVNGVLFRTLVWIHRPLFDRIALHEETVPDLNVSRGSRWVGIMYVEDVRVTPGAIQLWFPMGYGLYRSYYKPVEYGYPISGQWYEAGWWPWQSASRPRDG